MPPKTIAIVTPYYAPAWPYGGPPKVLSLLAESLVQLGHRVVVCTSNSLGEETTDKAHEVLHGVEVYRFPLLSNTLGYTQKIFYIPSFLHHVSSIVKECEYVVCADARSLLNLGVFSFLQRNKIPYGIFPYGQIPRGTGWKRAVKYFFDIWWVGDFFRGAQHVFCQTEHEQKETQEKFRCRDTQTVLLPLPMQVVDAKKRNKKRQHLLFVGRIHPYKGVPELIALAAPFLRKHRDQQLHIVGRDDGGLSVAQQSVPDDVRDQVAFVGPLYGADTQKKYQEARCFVFLPTYYEETPTAGLEALAQGCPVIVTPQAEIPYLDESRAGYTIGHSAEEFIAALQNIYNRDENEVAQATQELIQRVFEQHSVAEQFIRFISTKAAL